MYNLLIGGAAGQGVETTVAILQKLLKRSGYYVFTVRDFMSRIRGGHNFSLIRFGMEPIYSHSDKLDGMIALSEETIKLHIDRLNQNGFILCDSHMTIEDPRAIKLDMATVGKELGNPRVVGSVSVGAVLKLFEEKIEDVEAVLKEYIKVQYLEVNLQALSRGYQLAPNHFPRLSGNGNSNRKNHILLTGNEALSLGAIAAGLKFYSAYPMSPATSILEYLASISEEAGIVVEQAEDEIAAINMAIGASFAGVPAMTGTSGGGFSLMVEALGLAGMAEIPVVAVDVMRPGPATGLPTRTEQSDLKFVISASQGEFPRMVIAIRNHIDAFDQTVRAFRLAEKYQIPVILLSDQYLGDASATVETYELSNDNQLINQLNKNEFEEDGYLRYLFTEDGISPRRIPGKGKAFVTADSDEHDERGWITEESEMRTCMMDKRLRKFIKLKEELVEPDVIGEEEFDVLLLGWGSMYGPIKEAVSILNSEGKVKFSALVFGDLYPLPQVRLKEMAVKTDKIINIEQNATGQLADLIREQTGIVCTSSIKKYDGRQLSGEEIVSKIREGVTL